MVVGGFLVQRLLAPRYCRFFWKINGVKSSSGRNKVGSSWLGLEAREDPSGGTSTARIVRLCYPSSGGAYGLFAVTDRARGVGGFIGRGTYLQWNLRKQERTGAGQSSSCSRRGAALSLHQTLRTQSLRSSGAETTPRAEDVIVNT